MLTPRLEMILKHIEGKSCADIGTDHAYIPIELAECGMRVIATDISRGPLNIAAENAKKHEKMIDLRLGGGLSPIEKGEVDTIVIAGMGGEMIEKIISEDMEKAQSSRLVLQPMNSQAELRKFLSENNFCIIEEDLAVEGFKVYNLLVVKWGRDAGYRYEIDAHLPKMLYSHPLFDRLLAKKRREFTKILSGLLKASEKDNEKIFYYENLLRELEKIERGVKV